MTKAYSYSEKVNDALKFTWKWRPENRHLGRYEKSLIDRGWAEYQDAYNAGWACEDFSGYASGKKGPYHGGDFIQTRCLTLTDEGLRVFMEWNNQTTDSYWSDAAIHKYPHRQYFVDGYSIALDPKVFYYSKEFRELSTVPGYEKILDYNR